MAHPLSASSAAFASSLALAAIGYISTTMQTLRSQQHQDRVQRVGDQLKLLYGPLLACVTASRSSYEAMMAQMLATSGSALRDDPNAPAALAYRQWVSKAVRDDPQAPAAVAYREWVREVLMPLSERAAKLVIVRRVWLEPSRLKL